MDDSNEVALKINNVSKTFKLPHERHSGLKQSLVSKLGGKYQRGYELQHVLKDISFEVKKGEFFGIVGRNGSGKSTLLKIISGIYAPDKGSVQMHGSLTPFIELGVGFNPELTGRENVFLNGALMGFSRKEMEEKYDDIVEFAELENFMDQKLKNYSSGMQVRLAFSIAIQSESDILILDEVLAVGDEAFQRKCNDYFMKIKEDPTKTVVLVTHSMDSVKRYCDRALMIKDGEVTSQGDPEDVASEYSMENSNLRGGKNTHYTNTNKTELIKDFSVELISQATVSEKDPVRVKVAYTPSQDLEASVVVGLNDAYRGKTRIFTRRTSLVRTEKDAQFTEILDFDISQLNDVTIKVMAAVYDEEENILAFNDEKSMPRFLVRRTDAGIRGPSTALLVNKGD